MSYRILSRHRSLDGSDYFRRLFRAICEGKEKSAEELKAAGFTVREIGILLQKSKSGIGRELLADKESV